VIGSVCFSGTGLAFVDLGRCLRLSSVGMLAFAGCDELGVATFPARGTSMGPDVFRACGVLRDVELGEPLELSGVIPALLSFLCREDVPPASIMSLLVRAPSACHAVTVLGSLVCQTATVRSGSVAVCCVPARPIPPQA
jgi:hypothetical protein